MKEEYWKFNKMFFSKLFYSRFKKGFKKYTKNIKGIEEIEKYENQKICSKYIFNHIFENNPYLARKLFSVLTNEKIKIIFVKFSDNRDGSLYKIDNHFYLLLDTSSSFLDNYKYYEYALAHELSHYMLGHLNYLERTYSSIIIDEVNADIYCKEVFNISEETIYERNICDNYSLGEDDKFFLNLYAIKKCLYNKSKKETKR